MQIRQAHVVVTGGAVCTVPGQLFGQPVSIGIPEFAGLRRQAVQGEQVDHRIRQLQCHLPAILLAGVLAEVAVQHLGYQALSVRLGFPGTPYNEGQDQDHRTQPYQDEKANAGGAQNPGGVIVAGLVFGLVPVAGFRDVGLHRLALVAIPVVGLGFHRRLNGDVRQCPADTLGAVHGGVVGGRGLVRYPADAVKVHLHPCVSLIVVDIPAIHEVCAGQLGQVAGDVPLHIPGGDAVLTQDQSHRRGKLHTVALLGVEEEILNAVHRRIHRGQIRRDGVGTAHGADDVVDDLPHQLVSLYRCIGKRRIADAGHRE